MEERRSKGLYYYCDEKYHVGHRCSRPKLFLLDGLEGGDVETEGEEWSLSVIQTEESLVENSELGELLEIFLHALAGSLAPKTMSRRYYQSTKSVNFSWHK